jgi:Fe2+ or Zn2+ uptake regulation protein
LIAVKTGGVVDLLVRGRLMDRNALLRRVATEVLVNQRTPTSRRTTAPSVLADRLVCTSCGSVATVEIDDLAAELRASAERHGVEIEGHALTVFGRCAGCRVAGRGVLA